jgi:hypothetical protein
VFTESGSIEANGGDGNQDNSVASGSGGGGMVAIYYTKSSSSFKGSVAARQGYSGTDYPGGGGSIYISQYINKQQNYTQLIVDDGNQHQDARYTVLFPTTNMLEFDLIQLPEHCVLIFLTNQSVSPVSLFQF